MKKTIDSNEFIKAFEQSQCSGKFTHEGLFALFDYFESIDEGMEFDIVSIACDYAESTTDELIRNYKGIDQNIQDATTDGDELSDDEKNEIIADYLNDNTSVVYQDGDRFVFAVF